MLYRLYYSSVHLVVARVEDGLGHAWYQLRDDQHPNTPQYVRAEGLRLILPEEMTPLSPDAEDKQIEVDTPQPMVYAYENGLLVFSTRCSTRARFNVEDLGLVDFTTPLGQFSVIRKRPRRRMIGFRERSDGYDLPSDSSSTRLLIYAPAALHREAWRALLKDQPSIIIDGALADATRLADFLPPERPTTLLIDLPAPQPDLIKPLR